MPSNRSGCERASLMTFRVKLKKLCGKRLSKEDEKLAASMAVMKVRFNYSLLCIILTCWLVRNAQ